MSLFRKMSIDALIASSEDPEKKLRRTLGPWSLTSLGIGAVIGSGIFTVIGTAIAGYDGRFNLLLFLLTLIGGVAIQVGTNLVNDYFDYVKGSDEHRPARPVRVVVHHRFSLRS